MGEHSLTIKEWTGTGTPDLKLEWKAVKTSTKYSVSGPLEMLEITRKSDGHSSRFAIMANLSKSNHTLSWGYPEAVFVSDVPAGSEIPGTDRDGFYRGGGGRFRLSRR